MEFAKNRYFTYLCNEDFDTPQILLKSKDRIFDIRRNTVKSRKASIASTASVKSIFFIPHSRL